MRYLLFLLVPAFFFPIHVNAVSPSSCDEGTVECYCPEDIDIEDMDFNPLDPEGAEGLCKSLCISMQLEDAYVFSDIDSWALQCKIGGVLTPLGSGSLLVGDAATDALEATADEYLDPPTLGVDIPGFDPTLTESYFSSDGTFETNLLGVYVEAVYSYLISIFAIVAVVIIMAAGVMMMMSRGDGAKVTQAKNMISNALMGIVFLFGAYTIAFFINPELVTFNSLKVDVIDPEEYVQQSLDLPGALSNNASPGSPYIPGEIDCDSSYTLYQIAKSTVGQITYRYGGKGGAPPYTADTYTCKDGPCSSYCPDGNGATCLDCSGYAEFLRQCAGLESAGESGGTAGIFGSNAVQVTSCTDTTINGETLEPGDLLGWPQGHVFIYIGEGKIADSHGGNSGREPGNAVGIYDTTYACSSYVNADHKLYLRKR